MKILPAITTIFDWRGKLKELKELNLKEVALFLTCVNHKERREIYEFLKKTKINKVPFVHTRTDMLADEIEYLIKNYHTQAFNIHSKREYQYFADCEKYKKMIYIENTYEPFDEKEIQEFAGICLDFAHLESDRLFRHDIYKHNIELIERYGCGCNHISPSNNSFSLDKEVEKYPRDRHHHTLKKLSELDYLKRYPAKYFGELAALEMENPLKEQLNAKEYIQALLIRR